MRECYDNSTLLRNLGLQCIQWSIPRHICEGASLQRKHQARLTKQIRKAKNVHRRGDKLIRSNCCAWPPPIFSELERDFPFKQHAPAHLQPSRAFVGKLMFIAHHQSSLAEQFVKIQPQADYLHVMIASRVPGYRAFFLLRHDSDGE